MAAAVHSTRRRAAAVRSARRIIRTRHCIVHAEGPDCRAGDSRPDCRAAAVHRARRRSDPEQCIVHARDRGLSPARGAHLSAESVLQIAHLRPERCTGTLAIRAVHSARRDAVHRQAVVHSAHRRPDDRAAVVRSAHRRSDPYPGTGPETVGRIVGQRQCIVHTEGPIQSGA